MKKNGTKLLSGKEKEGTEQEQQQRSGIVLTTGEYVNEKDAKELFGREAEQLIERMKVDDTPFEIIRLKKKEGKDCHIQGGLS